MEEILIGETKVPVPKFKVVGSKSQVLPMQATEAETIGATEDMTMEVPAIPTIGEIKAPLLPITAANPEEAVATTVVAAETTIKERWASLKTPQASNLRTSNRTNPKSTTNKLERRVARLRSSGSTT